MKTRKILVVIVALLLSVASIFLYRTARANSETVAGCSFAKDEVGLAAATVNANGKPEVRLRWMTKRGFVPGVTFNLYRVGADQKRSRLNAEPLGSKAGTAQISATNARVSPDFKYTETLNLAKRTLSPAAQTIVDVTPFQRMESSQAFNTARDTIKQLRAQQTKAPGMTPKAFREQVMKADGVRVYAETLRNGTRAVSPNQATKPKVVPPSDEETTREARATLQIAALVHPQIARDLGYAFDDQTAQPGATYSYELRSVENGQECDVAVATAQLTVGKDQPIPSVTNLTAAQVDEDSVDLRWTRPADEESLVPTYKITRVDSKGSRETSRPIMVVDMKLDVPQKIADGRVISHVEPRSFYHDNGVAPGKVTYTVVMTDVFGRDSAPTSIDFMMEDWHTPDQVARVWAELRGNDARVSWTASETKNVVYRVYRVDAEKADAKPELLTTTAPTAGERIEIPDELNSLLVRRSPVTNAPRRAERAAAGQGASENWLAYIDKNVAKDHSYRYLVTSLFENRNDLNSPPTYSRVLPVPVTTLLPGPSNLKAQSSSGPQIRGARMKMEIRAAQPRQTNYGGTIRLTWDKVEGAKLYRIYRANASGYFNATKFGAAVPGDRRTQSRPNSPSAGAANARPASPSATEQKVRSSANPKATLANLSLREIQASKGVLRYVDELDDANVPDDSFSLIGQVNDATVFYDSFPRSQALTYTYRVVAVNRWNVPAAGMIKEAKYSSTKVRVPATLPPSTPVLLSLEPDKDGYLQLKIQGNLENEGVVRYHIYRRDLPLTTSIAEVQGSVNDNFKLNPIRVVHPASNLFKTAPIGGRAQRLPQLLVQHSGYQELTTINTGEGLKSLSQKGDLSFRDDTVLPMHEYFYYVVADNGDAKYSSKPSNILNSIPPKVRADAPASLKAAMAQGVRLAWPATTPDALYIVERANATGDHFAQLDGANTQTSYVDHSALAGHVYIYRVIAIEKSGAVSDPNAYPLDKPNKSADAYPARVKFTVPKITTTNQ